MRRSGADVTALDKSGPAVIRGAGCTAHDSMQRLSLLFDKDTMVLLSAVDGSGVYAVRGHVNSSRVVAYYADLTGAEGSVGAAGCRRIVATIDLAVQERCPVIAAW